MMSTPRRAVLAAAAATFASPALAQASWPTGPIRFIGIFPPGGGTDILSRIWCAKMSEISGQQFIVENRSGNAGNVGTEAIARSPADGNTIGLASVSSLSIAPIVLFAQIRGDVLNDPHLGYAIAFGMIALTAVANGIYIFLRMRAERWVK